MQNKDLKVHPMKDSCRAGEQRIFGELPSVCCFFFTLPVVRDIILSTQLLWISFYQPPCYGHHGHSAARPTAWRCELWGWLNVAGE